ncbi:MAG: DUF4139 domain-containing protein [Balneolaceae bacterium]|nr:MAG: DUF4139 domain-containing protein [Balneolaceae bacterium]
MISKMKYCLLLTCCLLISVSNINAQSDRPEMVTIYPANVSVIQHLIDTELEAGHNSVIIGNLPENTSSAAFFTLFDGELIEVLQQPQAAGTAQLLRSFTGKQIVLIDASNNRIEGELVSANPALYVLRHADGSYSYLHDIRQYRIVLDDYPEKFRTLGQTTLLLNANKRGRQTVKLFYRTQGLAWSAEHAFVLNEVEDALDISTSAILHNATGTDYENVRLRLIAGEIRLVGGGYMPRAEMMAMAESDAMGSARAPGFERSEAFEYYAFDTKERVTLINGDRKQVALFNAANVKVKKKYSYVSQTYGGSVENGRIAVNFEIRNESGQGLGEPLPAGITRIYRQTTDGIELVGESQISHSAVGSDIRFSTGNAFDLRAEERMTEQRQLQGRVVERDFEVILHNSKSEAVQIELSRRLSPNEEIIRSSSAHDRKDAHTAVFNIDVAANSKTTVTFTVRSGN